jgi:hypothetical protein
MTFDSSCTTVSVVMHCDCAGIVRASTVLDSTEHCLPYCNDAVLNATGAGQTHVMQEIGTMSTSLPIQRDSSVFLVVDENKSHCMRALITGPKDTPYQVTSMFNLLQFAGHTVVAVVLFCVNTACADSFGCCDMK